MKRVALITCRTAWLLNMAGCGDGTTGDMQQVASPPNWPEMATEPATVGGADGTNVAEPSSAWATGDATDPDDTAAGSGQPGPNVDDPPDAAGERSAPNAGDPPDDASGQTGSIVSVPSCDVPTCQEELAYVASLFDAPTGPWPTIAGGECILERTTTGANGTVVEGPACNCIHDGGGATVIGPTGAGCFVYGGPGECLWNGSDYTPCDTSAADACDAVCEELDARFAAEAARVYEVTVRRAQCIERQCYGVLEVDGVCWVHHSDPGDGEYDCALSDAEILEASLGIDVPDCAHCDGEDVGSDAGVAGYACCDE